MAAALARAEGHYHNSISSIGRGTGQAGIVAKAAYRAGECLYDERTGSWHDYRYKADRVIEKFIMLPDGAAAWGYDRNRLWNASEAAEPRKNGRNATELELALPHALSDEQRHDMLADFVRQKVERYGVAADVAVHFGRAGNIHAHVVLSHREFGAEGFGEPCNAQTVVKKRKGQFKAETVYGLAANPDAVKELRREWADHQNAWFEKLGLAVRVDHRSFDERGLKQTPTKHLGPQAAAMEARGIRTDLGDINRMIEVGNAEVRRLERLEATKQRLDAQIIDLQAAKAQRAAARGQVTENFPQAEEAPPMQTPDNPPAANQNSNPDLEVLETDELEQRKAEGFQTFRPSEPEQGRYDELKPEPPAPATTSDHRESPEETAGSEKSKAELVEEIMFRMGDMHSHYDIEPRNGGFALVRSFEIDDEMLLEYGLPAEQVHSWEPTLDELHDVIINREGPFVGVPAPQPELSRAEAWQQPELSDETMRADPWTAVYLPIPKEADELLLHNASHYAMRCFDEPQHPDDLSGEGWRQRRRDAGERVQELSRKIYPILSTMDSNDEMRDDLIYRAGQADLVQAWQAPAFSRSTIDADAWTAVYLPIPENPAPELLAHARSWAADLERYAAEGGPNSAFAKPFVTQPNDAPEPQAAAAARIAELDARLEKVTERVAPDQSAEPTAEPERAAGGENLPGIESMRAAELEAAGQGAVDHGVRFGSRLLGRIAGRIESAIQHFSDMIAPAPKMTAQQVHDHLQAHVGNLEKDHAIAADAAQQEHEAARAEEIFRADQQQQQADLSLAQRFGRNATREANIGREHDREPDRGYERD